MRNERPTRAKLEASIRESFVARGIPHRTDVIDGPPMFDPFHEELVQLILNEMDGAWSAFVALVPEVPDEWVDRGASVVPVRGPMLFDFSDVRAESDLMHECPRYSVHDDPYVDLGGEA